MKKDKMKTDEMNVSPFKKEVKFVYTFGSTVDEKYVIPSTMLDDMIKSLNYVSQAVSQMIPLGLKADPKDMSIDDKIAHALQDCQKKLDSETKVFTKDVFDILKLSALNYLKSEGIIPRYEESLGSGATYSYTAASKMYENDSSKTSHFVGTMPFSVMDFLIRNGSQLGADFCRNFMEYASQHNNYNCRTMALEADDGTRKFMVAYMKGRDAEELDTTKMQSNIAKLFNQETKNYVVQLGSLNKGGAGFHRKIRDMFEHEAKKESKNLIIYSGTSSFEKIPDDAVIGILRVVYDSHILSMNEKELDQIYSVLGGSKTQLRGERIKELDSLVELYNRSHADSKVNINPNQIKVCHSAHGAVAHISPKGPDMAQVQKYLQLSVDASSRKYETGSYGSLNEVMGYSQAVKTRKNAEFIKIFVSTKGLVTAIAPHINNPKSSLTGLGAVFDGYASATLGLCYCKVKP